MSKKYIDIRFVFEERVDEYDDTYRYVELVKVKRKGTNMAEHGEEVAERFAQTDFYSVDVTNDLIDVFAGKTVRYDR